MKSIELRGKKGKGNFALVDDEDFERINAYKWCINRGYAGTSLKGKYLMMHREIFNDIPTGYVIDHINRNKLDNRKCNLRFCNKSQNAVNTRVSSNNISGHKGVSWHKVWKKWMVRVIKNYKTVYLKYFDKKEDAIAARKKVIQEIYGDFSPYS